MIIGDKQLVNKAARKVIPVIIWLVIWQLVALIIHNHILLAGPAQTIKALIGLSQTQEFWSSVGQSVSRILLGLLLGCVLGIVLAYLAYMKEIIRDFLKPLVLAVKSVPVASFVILLLIWFGSRNISVIICMLVVFPILYLSTLEGLLSTDGKMLEMAKVYRMPRGRVIRYIFLPGLKPFFQSSVKLAVGMSFKSGIAAEVIGQPLHTMGNGLYQAKIYLETGELFAWTIVIIFISFIIEKILELVMERAL